MSPRKICVGQFAGAHGVRGLVKLRSFTENPDALFSYAPLLDERGREIHITKKSAAGDIFIAAVAGIATKEAADALRGDKIYIPRTLLPEPQAGEYYHADLIGLTAHDAGGAEYGKILAIHNYGAGTILEIGNGAKDSFMLPLRDEFVPEIDIDNGTARIIVPEGWVENKSKSI